jgi:GntR family transcriptional regulator/MocR family aminotransferase
VYRAYHELQALGYLESRPGSYMTVRKRLKTIMYHHDFHRGMLNWARTVNRQSDELFSLFHTFKSEKSDSGRDCVNFSRLDMDHRLMPAVEFRRCINQVLVNEGQKVLEYGDYAGYYPLREYIAQHMQNHGIATVPQEILITNGSQQALDLIIKLLTIPGYKVAVEAPTYAIAIPLFLFYRVEPVEIAMNQDGLDLIALEKTIETEKPAFLYTIPNFQNPTGTTTSQSHRENLLAICENYNLPLVEDGFEEEMKYFGKVALPIKSMDRNRIVLYMGTFSKVLFPGIRVGWIVADKECIERLTAIRRFCDLSCNTLTQAALNHFCRQGYYNIHIKRMHRIFRKRMLTAFNALAEYLPPDVKWTRPDGGYTIWLELAKDYKDKDRLQDLLNRHGVSASAGEFYFAKLHPKKYLRLSIATLDEDEIRKGIKRLGLAISKL